MILYTCEQNSSEWDRLRMTIPTASMFATVMAKGEGKTRSAYMRKLAGSILTDEPAENYTNAAMERGHEMEDEARRLYAFQYDVEPELVGFVTNDDGTVGGSPDSFIGSDGILEIKTAAPHVLIEKIVANKFPPEHVAQCQGLLWVTERDWLDLIVYWPKMPPFVKRAKRDEAYIKNLASEVERFNDDLAVMVEQVRRFGRPPEPLKAKLEQSILMAG